MTRFEKIMGELSQILAYLFIAFLLGSIALAFFLGMKEVVT